MKDEKEYAVMHELKCVELRLNQIKGYLEKIELLCRGVEYKEANKTVKGIKADFNFSWKKYDDIKKKVQKIKM